MGGIQDIEPDDLKNVPTFRAAYSDRTALLMAKLAHRAYDPFHIDDAAFASFKTAFAKLGFDVCECFVDRDVGTAG